MESNLNVPFEINFREKKMFKYVHVKMALLKKKINWVVFAVFFVMKINTASWSCRTFI